MTSLFTEEGSGESKNTLTEAIADAIHKCLSKYNGEHSKSITVLIDGYSFDGENYHVNVKVIFVDHELEHEDLYHEVEKEREEREELSHELAAHLYAAAHGFGAHRNHTGEIVKEALHHMEGGGHHGFDYDSNNLTIYADDQTQQQIKSEWERINPSHEHAPTLGLGTGSHGDDAGEGKAA